MRGILGRPQNAGASAASAAAAARYLCSLPPPLLRPQFDKQQDNRPDQHHIPDPDQLLLQEAAAYAHRAPSEIRLIRPLKFIYSPTTEAPLLYTAGPRDSFPFIPALPDLLAALRCQIKHLSWQVLDSPTMGALELLGSISHLDPGTRIVSNPDHTRHFAIVDLILQLELRSSLGLRPGERLATGLGLCTVPGIAVRLGALVAVPNPIPKPSPNAVDQDMAVYPGFDRVVDLRIDGAKFVLRSVDQHVRAAPLGLDEWVEMRERAARLVVRQCVTVDLSRLVGSSSNVAVFWPMADGKLAGRMQRLLRDVSVRTRGCTARWGAVRAGNVREVEIVPREDVTELERYRFVEPRWLSYREVVPLCRELPPAVVKRKLRIRRPLVGHGRKPRPRYWYKLLQKKGPDMKDSDGGYHGFRHVPLHMAMRRKLNRAQRVLYGFRS